MSSRVLFSKFLHQWSSRTERSEAEGPAFFSPRSINKSRNHHTSAKKSGCPTLAKLRWAPPRTTTHPVIPSAVEGPAFPSSKQRLAGILAILILVLGAVAQAQSASAHFNGERALTYTRDFVTSTGPRYIGSEGHAKAEAWIRKQFAHDHLELDSFTATTPQGPMEMHNYIVRFPGKKDGVILLGTHYETNYPLRNIHFVGANDGGATTGLLTEMANHLRGHVLPGYSVWLVFFDGEEAVEQWSDSDSTYGSRHLAAKWSADGTLKKIKAYLLTDMIGDKDLDIERDQNSTPWMLDLVYKAASKYGYQSHFYKQNIPVEDDQLAFVKRGVPTADVIDMDYGPNDSWHHTADDTLDKVSAKSLTIDGDTLLETIRLLDEK